MLECHIFIVRLWIFPFKLFINLKINHQPSLCIWHLISSWSKNSFRIFKLSFITAINFTCDTCIIDERPAPNPQSYPFKKRCPQGKWCLISQPLGFNLVIKGFRLISLLWIIAVLLDFRSPFCWQRLDKLLGWSIVYFLHILKKTDHQIYQQVNPCVVV